MVHAAIGSWRPIDGIEPTREVLDSMSGKLRIKFRKQRVVLDVGLGTVFKSMLAVGLIVAALLVPVPGVSEGEPRIAFALFVGAAALWITELIPPFATAILVIVLSVYLLGNPTDGNREVGWETYLNPVASPVLVLFFGGFFLALAASKHGFDVRLARAFITPFGTRPTIMLLGIILTTALFSMFMSNTATTAMMIAIIGPVFSKISDRPRTRKMFVLAVPFAANLGGMGTIIGTPPNAVAASVLSKIEGGRYAISFVHWMLVAVPVVLVMLFLLWAILILVFRPRREPLALEFPGVVEITPALAVVVAVFVLTVSMWLAQPLHGIPSSVVAMLPIAIFPALGILNREDLKHIDWDIIILVAGGMTLGVAMRETGLSTSMVSAIPFDALPLVGLMVAITLVSIVLSNFMSNTAASNMLIPIVTSMTFLSPRLGALLVAFACSMAMSLPISTPPNAIAFATREVSTRDIARYGTLVSALGLILLLIAVTLVGDPFANSR